MAPDEPKTRIESYYNNILKKLQGQTADKPDSPLTREEEYLDEISENLESANLEDARGHYFGGDSE